MEKLAAGTKVVVGQHEAEIVSYIAEGGFAHIYRVTCTPPENGSDDAVLKRVVVPTKSQLNVLRNEVDTMRRLAHSEYAVRYYDSHAQKLPDGKYEVLLLMEHCPNGSLLDFMNKNLKTKLSGEQITTIMFEVTQALADMHVLGLIHRDLKIENVLIDSSGSFKLADFGSTSSFLPPPRSQEEFQVLATDIIHNTTPQYRAPEMIDLYRGLPIDSKSDIWALGVFLFKLMYYTTPFEAQGELAILHGYFRFPDHPKYPSRLKNLVIIMLQVNPMLRPNVYQVLCEICDMRNEPIPIKDTYGLGKYDFDAYAAYQQQIALQQQQQQQIQQQYLQQKQQGQQKLQDQAQVQMTQANLTSPEQPQKSALTEEDSVELKRRESIQSINPQELTRSSKSSVGDLKSLGDTLEKQMDAEDESGDPELENVEDRFPDLEDIEAASQKFPDIRSLELGKSPEFRDSLNLSEKSVDGSRSPSEGVGQENEGPQRPGLKLSKTEAWTVPPKDVGVGHLDGVFHKAQPEPVPESQEPELTSPPDKLKAKSSFDNLFDFDSDPKTTTKEPNPSIPVSSVPSQAQSRNASQFTIFDPSQQSTMSRNPFPTGPTTTNQPVSKNPFPTGSVTQQAPTSSLEVKNVLRPERSGGNPWAQYTQNNHYQTVQSQPPPQLPPQLPQRHQNQQSSHSQSSQQLCQSIQQQPTPKQMTYQKIKEPTVPPQQPPRPHDTVSFSTPTSLVKNSNTSPSIKLTTSDAKLVDLDDRPKEHRPKINLHLHSLELGTHGEVADEEDSDTDTDSNGDLKVEIMKVRTKSTPRSSMELNRLNLDLQELDLNDEAVEDGDEKRHSRRSMSLKRTSSNNRKTSRSRSNRYSEESKRSFLGL